MKIMITDSKGDSISITIGDNGSFRELNKPLEKGHEMHMDFSSVENGKHANIVENNSTRLSGNIDDRQRVSSLNFSDKSVDEAHNANLQLLEEQVKSCMNEIRIDPGIGSRIKEPDIKVSISSDNNEIFKSKSSLCRLCAKRGSDMVYMFETNGQYKNVIDKIEDCLPIMITKTDTLPKEACRSCIEKLELCHKFHKTVAEAEKHFLILGGKISYDPEKTTKYCQTINEDSITRSLGIEDENGINFDATSASQANSPNICVEDSDEDESSLAERMSDSKNNKFVNRERKRARKEEISSKEAGKDKTLASQGVDSKTIVCKMCREGFQTVQKCYTHSKIHVRDNYYPCSLCDEIFTVEKDWSEHSIEHKEDNKELDKGASETHACNKCGKKFVTEARLEFHKIYHNPNAKPCYCEQCDTIVDSESALYQHLQTVHESHKEFRCEICGEQFRTQASVNAHQRKHRYLRSFECSICNRRFYSKDTLEMHEETHSNDKNFSCSYCGKSFAEKLPLTVHILSHTEDQSESFKSSKKTSGIKTDRPFKCNVCERTFDHSARLREHSSVHTGKRPYSCSLCDKSFKRANARKVHMIIHTGEKPYRCDMCGTNFRRAGDMRRHKKTQHGINE